MYSAIKVHAVVVAYYPNLVDLDCELALLTKQVNCTWIIDNGSTQELKNLLRKPPHEGIVKYVSMNGNKGIAKAQNKGIDLAILGGADYILLMDQDSQPSKNMVENLLKKAIELPSVAAVGPCFQDYRRNKKNYISRIYQKESKIRVGTDLVKSVSHLISSGCLIPVGALKQVGYMREDLFIDYVDIEWCFRAKLEGLQSYEISEAHMSHKLGDEPLRFFGKTVASHSPLRHYYQFRNAILMYRNSKFPMSWKVKDAWYMTQKFILFMLLAKPRVSHMKMMTLGIWHGILKKSGDISMQTRR